MGTGTFCLETMSLTRFWGTMAFVVVPRLIIAGGLACTGCAYLLATRDPEDLIVNAIALEVVLNIDEVFYEAFIPRSLKYVIANLEPVKISHKVGRLPHVMILVRVLAYVSVIIVIALLWMVPCLNAMKEVTAEMCAGNYKFVYRQDLQNRWKVVVSDTTLPTETKFNESYHYLAVLKATTKIGYDPFEPEEAHFASRNLPTSIHTGHNLYIVDRLKSDQRWRRHEQMSLEQTAEGAQCEDFDTHQVEEQYLVRLALKEVLSWDRMPAGCAELKDYCYLSTSALGHSGKDDGDFVRFACPKTCGCHDPHTVSYWLRPLLGVPPPVLCSSPMPSMTLFVRTRAQTSFGRTFVSSKQLSSTGCQ